MTIWVMGKLYMSPDEFDKPYDQFTDELKSDEEEEFA